MTISNYVEQYSGTVPNKLNQTPNEFHAACDTLLSFLVDMVEDLETWTDELNATQTSINNSEIDASGFADAAEADALSAGTARNYASQWATAPIGTEINDGVNDPGESSYAWAQKAMLGERFTATSATSNSIGAGAKTFTLNETHRSFASGSSVTVSDATDPGTNYMTGIVTDYNPATDELTVDVADYEGSGTFTAWSVCYRVGGSADLIGGHDISYIMDLRNASASGAANNQQLVYRTATGWGAEDKVSNGGFAQSTGRTTDLSLATTDERCWDVSFSSTGLGVNLPAPGTLEEGGPVFIIQKVGGKDFTIENASGAILSKLTGYQRVSVFLCDGAWVTIKHADYGTYDLEIGVTNLLNTIVTTPLYNHSLDGSNYVIYQRSTSYDIMQELEDGWRPAEAKGIYSTNTKILFGATQTHGLLVSLETRYLYALRFTPAVTGGEMSSIASEQFDTGADEVLSTIDARQKMLHIGSYFYGFAGFSSTSRRMIQVADAGTGVSSFGTLTGIAIGFHAVQLDTSILVCVGSDQRLLTTGSFTSTAITGDQPDSSDLYDLFDFSTTKFFGLYLEDDGTNEIIAHRVFSLSGTVLSETIEDTTSMVLPNITAGADARILGAKYKDGLLVVLAGTTNKLHQYICSVSSSTGALSNIRYREVEIEHDPSSASVLTLGTVNVDGSGAIYFRDGSNSNYLGRRVIGV